MMFQSALFCLMIAVAPPLTDSQQTRLDTATDHSTSFASAALYALLENSAASNNQITGAIVPDYHEILANPQTQRGQLFLIEGKLKTLLQVTDITRKKWQKTQAFTIEYEPEKYLIIFLTNEPPLTKSEQSNQGIFNLKKVNYNVRLAGRFYKVIDRPGSQIRVNSNEKPPRLSYLIFVGHSFNQLTPPPSQAQHKMSPWTLPVILVVALIAFYWVARKTMGKKTPISKVDEIRKRHEQRRMMQNMPQSTSPQTEQTTLPDDPAEALDQLGHHQG